MAPRSLTRRGFLGNASFASMTASTAMRYAQSRGCRAILVVSMANDHCSRRARARLALRASLLRRARAERRCRTSTASSRRRRCISSAITQAFPSSIPLNTNCSFMVWSRGRSSSP
jgi:hypothetical protein